jgi:transmembrane sensor
MSELYQNIDDLLAKTLSQEASAEEAAIVKKWLDASPENPQYFKEFEWMWEKSLAAKSKRSVDTEGALQKLHQRMDALPPELKMVKSPSKILNLSFIMKVAAALLISFFIYNNFSEPEKPVILVATAKPQTDTLADGSVITLNKKSALTLSEKYNKKERRMTLTGEAYFEVAHDIERPFIVEVQDVEIKAVGTAFNIDNTTDSHFVYIMVTDGKVKIASKAEEAYAEKGQTAVYDVQTGAITIEKKEDKNKVAYKTRQLHFDETPLSMALLQLSKAYDISFILSNKNLENCPLTVSFDNKSLDAILEILQSTFSCTTEKTNEAVVLNGGKCP